MAEPNFCLGEGVGVGGEDICSRHSFIPTDMWANQVQPLAANIPYMTGVGTWYAASQSAPVAHIEFMGTGNHEKFYNYSAYLHRFRNPKPWGGDPAQLDEAVFWFSLDYGRSGLPLEHRHLPFCCLWLTDSLYRLIFLYFFSPGLGHVSFVSPLCLYEYRACLRARLATIPVVDQGSGSGGRQPCCRAVAGTHWTSTHVLQRQVGEECSLAGWSLPGHH